MKSSIFVFFKNYYGKYGIPAFNVFNAEQVKGVFEGADKAKLPVIIAITPVARNYISHDLLEGLINASARLYPAVEFCVHLDHGNPEHCYSAIESSFV